METGCSWSGFAVLICAMSQTSSKGPPAEELTSSFSSSVPARASARLVFTVRLEENQAKVAPLSVTASSASVATVSKS